MIIAWIASGKWMFDVFNSHGKIYEVSVNQMFKIPIEEIIKTSLLIQKS